MNREKDTEKKWKCEKVREVGEKMRNNKRKRMRMREKENRRSGREQGYSILQAS